MVVAGNQVFTFGVASHLYALDFLSGNILWKRDCAAEDGVKQYFFGSGASPLIHGENVVLNLGGQDDACVVAFDRKSSKPAWTAKHAWGQSYASPVPATLQGQNRLLVFAGGESTPSTGGLLSIHPQSGQVEAEFPWRARRYASVNASSPVLGAPNQVLVTKGYVDTESPCNGAVLLEMTTERKWKEIWKNEEMGCHWMTPVYHDGHYYAWVGEKEHACDLVCVDGKSGKTLWKQRPTWPIQLKGQELDMGFRRASLLRADGHFLCLGEMGTLAWLDLSPDPAKGYKLLSKTQLFIAPHTWALPALSKGLLYVVQAEADLATQGKPRILCYDLRKPQ